MNVVLVDEQVIVPDDSHRWRSTLGQVWAMVAGAIYPAGRQSG
jgi:hypothetical protein